MKNILLWLFLIVFGFILGAGVGFKILQGISTQVVAEALDNSYAQFKETYSGSAAQKTVQENITNRLLTQKEIISQQIQSGLQNYAMGKLSTLFK